MKIKITDLKNNPANPRNITEKEFSKLITSLLVFPEMLTTRPMIINASHEVLGGNQRLRALLAISQMEEAEFSQRITNSSDGKKMKKEEREECIRHWVAFTDHQEIEVEMVHWTDHKQRQFIIKDNATFGEWDWNKLANEWDSDELNDWGVGVWADSGTENQEVEEDDFTLDGVEDSDDCEAVSKLGDVWQLGRHRLVCGDSTDAEMVNLLMSGNKADLLLTDPPYNVDYEGGTKDCLKIENDKMGDAEFKEFLIKAFERASGAIKAGASFYVWYASPQHINVESALNEVGLHVREQLIWVKNSLVLGMQDYQWKHEPCLYGWKEGARHNWYSDRSQTTVLEFNRPRRNGEHPTMKPLDLIGYLINNSTKYNEVVLDLFGGSGSTLIACEQLNRTCYMMELDPKYCDVIIKRYEAYTGDIAVKISN